MMPVAKDVWLDAEAGILVTEKGTERMTRCLVTEGGVSKMIWIPVDPVRQKEVLRLLGIRLESPHVA